MTRVLIRLYRRTDYDLLSLYLGNKKFFKKAMKRALVAFANDEMLFIKIPKGIVNNIPEDVRSQRFSFSLDEEDPREANAIKLLRGVLPKKKNEFIKQLVRGYFCGPAVSSYFIDGETKDYAAEVEDHFRSITGFTGIRSDRSKYFMRAYESLMDSPSQNNRLVSKKKVQLPKNENLNTHRERFALDLKAKVIESGVIDDIIGNDNDIATNSNQDYLDYIISRIVDGLLGKTE